MGEYWVILGFNGLYRVVPGNAGECLGPRTTDNTVKLGNLNKTKSQPRKSIINAMEHLEKRPQQHKHYIVYVRKTCLQHGSRSRSKGYAQRGAWNKHAALL
jgi:nicotinamidase-related amidase